MSREFTASFSYSAMRLANYLPSSTTMMDRKPLSPAAAYAKWAGRETTRKRPTESIPLQMDVAKVRKPKLELKLGLEREREWKGSSPTPSITFLPKSQLWSDVMPEMPQRPVRLEGDEPPQVRAPPPSPRLRSLDFNQKIFSRLFDEAVATTKRRQQDANATFFDA